MLNFLRTTFKYGAGLAGLAALLFLSVTKQWVTSSAFKNLDANHVFYSFVISTIISAFLALCFLACHILEKRNKSHSSSIVTASNNSNAINNTGNGSITINRDHSK